MERKIQRVKRRKGCTYLYHPGKMFSSSGDQACKLLNKFDA